MTDHAWHIPERRRRAPRMEYRVYFALVLLLALPLACLRWAVSLTRPAADAGTARKGPLALALSDARALTPMIFSA